MQCVILAAGNGTRMGDRTALLPKPMLRVANRPIIEYKIHALPDSVTEIVIVVGYQCHQIVNYFGSYVAGRPVRYALQPELRGTADALAVARPFLGERFMVLMGDDLYTRDDLARLAGERLAILGAHHDNVQGKGVIITDERGNMAGVTERFPDATPGLVNAAAYMLTQDFFAYAPVTANNGHVQEVGLPQTLARMAQDHPVAIHRATAWLPITTPDDLALAATRIADFL